MTQYHHVDESGDPGLASTKSSVYFVLAVIQLPERTSLPEFAQLRKDLHFPADFEFHFKKMTLRQKECFFEAISFLPFRARIIYLNKSSCSAYYKSLSGLPLVIEMITQLILRSSPLDIAEDVLILDAATPILRRSLRIRLSEECQRIGRVRPFKKIISADSSSEDGLQLADMIAGATRQYVTEEAVNYYLSFANRVVDLYKLP